MFLTLFLTFSFEKDTRKKFIAEPTLFIINKIKRTNDIAENLEIVIQK